jgi:hypothetical protein
MWFKNLKLELSIYWIALLSWLDERFILNDFAKYRSLRGGVWYKQLRQSKFEILFIMFEIKGPVWTRIIYNTDIKTLDIEDYTYNASKKS